MALLLCNDDGIDASGLRALEEGLKDVAPLFVVAPNKERSAQSHALTMHKPLFARPRGEGRWAVSGTPADCVYIALHGLLDAPPALVVSGINRGANLGYDVHYSGTVAGAREAVLHGVPGLSVSLCIYERGTAHWESAAFYARRVASNILEHGLPIGVHLNLNVPNLPLSEIKGLRTAVMGERRYAHEVDTRTDPRGRSYHWIGGPPERHEGSVEEDGPAIDAGWATVTPLTIRPTAVHALDHTRGWTDA